MGNQADNILLSFRLYDENKKKYDMVKSNSSHFMKCYNPIYKRVKFNQWKQLPGESVDNCITALCGLRIL